jgi:subtilisin-like proprotein convertase family protein
LIAYHRSDRSRNLSSETANGTWTLRVQDVYSADSGYLNSWTLTL